VLRLYGERVSSFLMVGGMPTGVGIEEDCMWKSKKPEEEKESLLAPKRESLTQKEEAMSAFEDRKPEHRFEPRSSPSVDEVVNIGKSVFIKGELTGDENLTIEGRVEGRIELKDHNLVIGPNGKINAEVNAKNVTVIGSVVGNISATEVVEIKSSGSVMGDIRSARVSIADGAHFKGSVDMQKSSDTVRRFDAPRSEPVKLSSEVPVIQKAQVGATRLP
jgi:cytoskeletal protein CcmA (bactofilin family)